MANADNLTQQRLDKLQRLRAAGINPYPNTYHRTHTCEQAVSLLKELEATGEIATGKAFVNVAGRIMGRRKMGKISFLDLRDGSGKIQLFIGDALPPEQADLLKETDIGDIIGATGKLFRTKTEEPTIVLDGFTILTKSLEPLPEKWHGLNDVETRYRQRYLDLISNPEVQRTFRTRSKIIAAIRQFYNERGFLEVETPVLEASAGGALARPFITHHNALSQDLYLRIATELHLKRLIVGGLDKVYEIGRIFRNEGIDTTHNPEFTTLESYEAYADYNDVMKMLEEMVASVCQQVLGTTKVKLGTEEFDLAPPWKRLNLREAVKEHSGIDFVACPSADSLRTAMKNKGIQVDPKKNWAHLVDELISTFVEPKLMAPAFLIDYPVSMSPLAKSKPGNDRVVERFEAFAAGMEIANAFSELNDPVEQRERFLQQQKEHKGDAHEEAETVDEDFLHALEYGMPPTGGLGIGIDRLIMLLTNQQSIREVILFPQLKGKPQGA
jgi:lysyl-tRNA synthetase class 2